MTPKEKALELYNKFSDATLAFDSGDHSAEGLKQSMNTMHQQDKRCAIVCVDEILNFRNWPTYETNYLNQVKEELIKM